MNGRKNGEEKNTTYKVDSTTCQKTVTFVLTNLLLRSKTLVSRSSFGTGDGEWTILST